MNARKFIGDLVKPLVQAGVYKDESSALKDIIIDFILKKRDEYAHIITGYQDKYRKNFDQFSVDLKNTATPDLEDDWLEWKAAIEMQKGWEEAYRTSLYDQAV
jgi:flagellar biosynthesis/type III secretory pathway protein FliH